jgi:DNA-binding PadR family transcriptional regulator
MAGLLEMVALLSRATLPMSAVDISDECEKTLTHVYSSLRAMKAAGLVQDSGQDDGRPEETPGVRPVLWVWVR